MTDAAMRSVTGEDRAARRAPWVTSLLCFVVILLDGYDTTVISFVAPSLAHDWALQPAAFTPTFVGTSLGAVIGYLCCGAVAARVGHRGLVIASVASFGLMSLATLLASGIVSLAVLRFVTGLGLGGAIPTAIALASAHAETRWRELTAAFVTLGIVVGGAVGGIVAVPLLRAYGWHGPFVLGAILPLVVLPALMAWLPDAPVRRTEQQGSPRALLQGGFLLPTLLLWAMALLSFMQSYSFTYWLPLLLTNFGFDRASASLGNSYLGSGAIAGVLLMMLLVRFVGSARYLCVAFAVGTGFILLIASGQLPNAALPALLFMTGATLGIGGVGQAAIGARLYPAAIRTTGVGWSSARGRVGSIFGPAITGAMLWLQWQPRDVIALAAVPAAAAAASALLIHLLTSRRAAAVDGLAEDAHA